MQCLNWQNKTSAFCYWYLNWTKFPKNCLGLQRIRPYLTKLACTFCAKSWLSPAECFCFSAIHKCRKNIIHVHFGKFVSHMYLFYNFWILIHFNNSGTCWYVWYELSLAIGQARWSSCKTSAPEGQILWFESNPSNRPLDLFHREKYWVDAYTMLNTHRCR